ncbi:hypothetical protein CQ035_03310 [Brevundimonas sp. MYb46]|nr:hypothetical protein CQ026_08445 [Brevundimonas sp. MYb31]PRA21898.1 hypothetical protein CQ024_15920 [Brevundimonas sp. MYb27]PRB16943.1 hypothetical protein CQ039_04685 [Brevundimonas sp. MYb52]PRB37342.1 hypothetical protein CQ035_03310 [Brevundimonas sp. MYb46]PRB54846.1 hypothetical protein CQ028_03435 [Brevundimonas sp. MYb33]
MKGAVLLKRAYEPAEPEDGQRVLVDRLWPRGVSKEKAAIDLWLKEIAPSTALRQWFNHDPALWEEFQRRYRAELDANGEVVGQLKDVIRAGKTTLVYGAKDEAHNDAVVLAEYLGGTTSAGS